MERTERRSERKQEGARGSKREEEGGRERVRESGREETTGEEQRKIK